jgi:membrane-bound lytic murein transglycosylase A
MKRAAWFLCLALLSACAEKPEVPEKLDLAPLSFEELPDWQEDKIEEALPALLSSCEIWNKREASRRFAVAEAGKAEDWQVPCAALAAAADSGEAGLRAVLRRWFLPYRVTNQKSGLFTGYYEASLRGARARGGKYQTPLWTRPDDMLNVDLGAFRESWKGQKITGKIDAKTLCLMIPRFDCARLARGPRQTACVRGRSRGRVFP